MSCWQGCDLLLGEPSASAGGGYDQIKENFARQQTVTMHAPTQEPPIVAGFARHRVLKRVFWTGGRWPIFF